MTNLEKKILILLFLETVRPHRLDRVPLISWEVIRDAIIFENNPDEKEIIQALHKLCCGEYVRKVSDEDFFYVEYKGLKEAEKIIRSLTEYLLAIQ